MNCDILFLMKRLLTSCVIHTTVYIIIIIISFLPGLLLFLVGFCHAYSPLSNGMKENPGDDLYHQCFLLNLPFSFFSTCAYETKIHIYT